MGKASRKKALRRAGIGDYKLSEALIELVGPMMPDEMSLQERQSLFLIATIAWNISIYPREQRARHLQSFISEMPGAGGDPEAEINRILAGEEPSADFPREKLEMLQMVIGLMEQKEALFPHDRRLVGKVELSESKGRYHLNVASVLAPADFDGTAS